MALTLKRKRFGDEYLVDCNGTQAAIRAGFSAKTAYSQASRLLKDVEVREYIRARKAELDAEYEARIMGKYEVLARLTEIARGDIGDLGFGSVDFITKAKAAGKSFLIKKVEETTFVNGADDTETHTVKLELYSAHEALRDLGKHHALFTEKVDVSSGGEPIQLNVVYVNPPEKPRDEL